MGTRSHGSSNRAHLPGKDGQPRIGRTGGAFGKDWVRRNYTQLRNAEEIAERNKQIEKQQRRANAKSNS